MPVKTFYAIHADKTRGKFPMNFDNFTAGEIGSVGALSGRDIVVYARVTRLYNSPTNFSISSVHRMRFF